MQELPLHDAQIKYIGFDPILSKLQFVIHRGDKNEKYFIVKIQCIDVIKILTLDGTDFNAILEDGGGIYEATISTFDDHEELVMSGPEYWQMTIQAKRILYSEKPILKDNLEAFMDENLDY